MAAAKAVLSNVMVPEFVPQRGVKIQVNEAEAAAAAAGGDVDEMQLDSIAAALPAGSTLAGAKLSPVEFEKDDDTYALCCACVRARGFVCMCVPDFENQKCIVITPER